MHPVILVACLVVVAAGLACGPSNDEVTPQGANPILRELDITMETLEGVVYLRSDKTNQEQRELAVKVAREVRNVVDVADQMK